MIEFLMSLFKPRSVASIVSDFSKQIERLEKAEAYQYKEEGKQQQAASDALKKAEQAKIEAARAKAVKSKIEDLIN